MPVLDASGPGMAAYVWDGYVAFHQPKFECVGCKFLVFKGCGIWQNFYVFSIYRNTDLDDWNYECLLTSMDTVQAEDVRASFLL